MNLFVGRQKENAGGSAAGAQRDNTMHSYDGDNEERKGRRGKSRFPHRI